MLPQEIALEKVCESLQEDEHVEAIFVKGSMGRNEYDEHSDIDLYCMIEKKNEAEFLSRRLDHLNAYRSIMFYDDIFIVAPQIIAVYDDFLHIDLFAVTKESYIAKDYFKVLYDPNHLMDEFIDKQDLVLSDFEYRDNVIDVAWFMFQYKKSAARGNDIWSVKMLSNVMEHLARVLLHRYCPERGQLGLKTIEKSLPESILTEINKIFEQITPDNHRKAACLLSAFLLKEAKWIHTQLKEGEQAGILLDKMIAYHLC